MMCSIGPKHMELFASDPVVAEKFKKAVLEQDYGAYALQWHNCTLSMIIIGCLFTHAIADLQPHTPNPQASHKRLVLPSGDAEDYVADLLYKVMPI